MTAGSGQTRSHAYTLTTSFPHRRLADHHTRVSPAHSDSETSVGTSKSPLQNSVVFGSRNNNKSLVTSNLDSSSPRKPFTLLKRLTTWLINGIKMMINSNSASSLHMPTLSSGSTSSLQRLISVLSTSFLVLFILFLAVTSTSSSNSYHLYHPERHNATVPTSHLLTQLTSLDQKYKTKSENVVYDRYARVYDREIEFPDGKSFMFDIWGRVWKNNSFSVVAIVPFHSHTQTFTLVREYNPAHTRHVYGFPQGMVEWSKHETLTNAAAAELEEEAHLACDHLVSLLSNDDVMSGGVPQDKYQRESVYFFLCADSKHVDNPAHLDDEEESLEIVHGITVEQVHELARAGALQSNNIAAGLMAVEKLRDMRLVPR